MIEKKVITISDNAAKRIRDILSNAEGGVKGVRVSVKSGGCAGMEYEMTYLKETLSTDEIVKDNNVEVHIDPKAIMYLLGTTMDYKEDKFSSSFVFNNPNETERCGCGESFKI
jgi:iron-sulfur cluster assembly protein